MKITLIILVNLALIFSCQARGPTPIAPQNPNAPERLPKDVTRKVLVIGGGLAGLSAAIELADRGYQVTIKEKMEHSVGGKLATKPVKVLNETFYVEHGFHAWFGTYYQFQDIRSRLEVNDNFVPWKAVNYVFRDYKPELIYSEGPYPLNLIGVIERSPNLHLTDGIMSSLSLRDLQ